MELGSVTEEPQGWERWGQTGEENDGRFTRQLPIGYLMFPPQSLLVTVGTWTVVSEIWAGHTGQAASVP